MSDIDRAAWVRDLLDYHRPNLPVDVLSDWRAELDRAAGGSLADLFPHGEFTLIRTEEASFVGYYLYAHVDNEYGHVWTRRSAGAIIEGEAKTKIAKHLVNLLYLRRKFYTVVESAPPEDRKERLARLIESDPDRIITFGSTPRSAAWIYQRWLNAGPHENNRKEYDR